MCFVEPEHALAHIPEAYFPTRVNYTFAYYSILDRCGNYIKII